MSNLVRRLRGRARPVSVDLIGLARAASLPPGQPVHIRAVPAPAGRSRRLQAAAPLAKRTADKSYEMALNGDMAAYKGGPALSEPIFVDLGDRVEIKMVNMSMMAHPIHLHGHHFKVAVIDGRPPAGAMRDTVLVRPCVR